MIIVHDIFICKPGKASELAKKLKKAIEGSSEFVQVLTDLTGSFNKVIMVGQYESLAAFEENFKKYMEDTEEVRKMKEAMAGYQDLYLTGSREIYHSW